VVGVEVVTATLVVTEVVPTVLVSGGVTVLLPSAGVVLTGTAGVGVGVAVSLAVSVLALEDAIEADGTAKVVVAEVVEDGVAGVSVTLSGVLEAEAGGP